MQGFYSGAYMTFGLDFKHIKANAQNLIFHFIKCSSVILDYIYLIYIHKYAVFCTHNIYFRALNIIIPIIL